MSFALKVIASFLQTSYDFFLAFDKLFDVYAPPFKLFTDF
jgi:hypothetical protein